VLLIGPNALGAEGRGEAVAAIDRFVAAGRTALVLEQEQPLAGDELPVSGIAPAGNRRDEPARPEFLAAGGVSGRVAFPVAVAHPVLAGLTADDFFTWADGEWCFRASYASPTGGVIQIIQAGNELRLCPMLDIPVGKGGYLLSQMLIGEKLGVSPVADRLLANMLNWASARASAEPGTAVSCTSGDGALGDFLDRVELVYSPVDSPTAALASEADIAIVRATPQNLQQLAARKAAVQAFCEPGRWLMLVGVDQAGLDAFNDLVGVQHRLRPFRREAVVIEARTDPLLMGLSDRDVNMISDQVLAPWMNLNWVSDRTFSGVVDAGADVASFAQFGSDYLTKVANGLTNDDFWQYICYFGGTEREPVLEMPYDRPETFTGIDIWSNESYFWMKDIEVIFDDDEANALKFTLEPTKEKQELEFEPRRASKVTIRMLNHHPGESNNDLVGIDLLRLWRELPADWDSRVVQLTKPGGLVKYPIGEGGIVLNNVAYAAEDTQENIRKKLAIYSNMLRNMGAAFGD
jgi:beta-galactosidase